MNDTSHDVPLYVADWYVDSATNRLRHGDTEIKLESKVMAVLSYLATHPNELISREVLEQAVWGETVVGYDALTRCIAQLRKALGDDPRKPRYIETISKKGYRLIAPVNYENPGSRHATSTHAPAQTELPERLTSQTRKRSWLLSLGGLLLGLVIIGFLQPWSTNDMGQLSDHTEINPAARAPNQPSIVLLPFTNTGNDSAQRYFSDGMTADITTALSKLSGLRVISQSSAMGYRHEPSNIKQVAESLGVRYVLAGSVRRTDDRIRVNVNLVDSSSDVILWSEKYDRELHSVFDVQDDITSNIIQTLAVKLTEAEKRRTARRYTVSVDAYDDFLRGQAHYVRHTPEDNQLARDFFQHAVDRDASFARAWSAMALTYIAEHRYPWGERSNHQLDRALELATRGRSLDPELPQAYWVLGYVHLFRREYKQAAEVAGHAVALNPNYADSYLTLAICRIHEGAPEAAVSLARKAMLLNPEYPAAYASILGQSLFFSGQYEQAVSVLHEAIERNNNLLTAHVFLIAALSKQGQTEEATWAAAQLKNLATDFSASRVAEMLPVDDAHTAEEIKLYLQQAGL